MKFTQDRIHEILRFCHQHAAECSDDPSTQNCAAIVHQDSGRILCYDVNRFPDGVRQTPERWERPTKYHYVNHAEHGAVMKMFRMRIYPEEVILFCPWLACDVCARTIILAGIREVVGVKRIFGLGDDIPETNPTWDESIKAGDDMMDEAGVIRRYFDPPIAGIKLRRNGEIITV